ncbi:MAG: YfdQ family protein [Aeromonadaceae bacterium]|nr:YfdQ family protein [Aeromonadaceae bacterium]
MEQQHEGLSQWQALVTATQKPDLDGIRAHAIVPDGYELRDLESLRDNPSRVKASVKVLTQQALVGYLERFSTDDSVIFADVSNKRITGIIDYHSATLAEWCSHKAMYDCPLSEAWKAWTSVDKRSMGQLEFAEFLENRIADIAPVGEVYAGPSGAELLEMVLVFQETRKSEFKSVRRLNDGTFSVAFSDQNNGSGQAALPEKIKLSIQPFHNGKHYLVECRVRYRLRDGELKLWVELIEPDVTIEHAFNTVVDEVSKAMPDLMVLEAVAP